MHCPNGHGEFRDGIAVCHDCGAALVLDPPFHRPGEEPVTVLRTADSALLPVVESILAGAGIPYRLKGEETLHLFPATGVGLFVDPEAAGVEVQVAADRAEEARALLTAVDES